jgi:hypothetical protein
MSNVFLHGKPAVKVNGEFVLWGVTDKAKLYNIGGNEKWLPNSLCEYNDKEKSLIIEEWFYNKLFEK